MAGELERESRPQLGVTFTAEMRNQGMQIPAIASLSELGTELVQMPGKDPVGLEAGVST